MNEELRAAAEAYHNQGIPVIPFLVRMKENGEYDKTPRVSSWKQWLMQPQTNEEFQKLQWDGVNAFAVILGTKTKDDLYLCVIDYDVKGNVLTEEVKAKGKEILKTFPTTQTQETVNKGLHLIYFSRTKPCTEGSFHDTTGLELLGEKKICLMAPSFGYKNLNDNTPTEVSDLQTTFYETLEKFGFKLSLETENEDEQDKYGLEITKLVDTAKLTKIGPYEYQGKHPIHDSTTEKNFTVNVQDNSWYCFRHSSGGGALQFFAVKEGIIKCEQAKKGALRGKKFKAVISLAIAQGLIDKESWLQNQKEKEESQADKLIKLCLSQGTELFYDQHKTPYIRIREPIALRYCDISNTPETCWVGENILKMNTTPQKVSEVMQIPQYRNGQTRNVIIPIRSKQFKAWLSVLMWNSEEKAPGIEGLMSAINVLTGKALGEGKQYTLYNRVAPAEDGIWLDMTDDNWRAIKITPEGWEIVQDPPILFRRYNHQQALPEPIRVAEPDISLNTLKLLEYVNISKDDEKTKLTFLCTCISYLIPLIPHPIFVVHGPQGSAKTWFFRLIRRILDPSSIEVLSLPRDDRELIQQLDHNWLALYDNLTSLPTWVSDMLCRASTGSGFSKRELYSDDDDTIYNFKRCVGLNGINPAARRGDLLDRSILVCVEKIDNEKRKTEESLNSAFEAEKAAILGGFLGVLSKALKVYPKIELNGFFRMADFTRYGCAIAQALGKTTEDFLDAYEEKVESQNEEAINANPVAMVIVDYFQNCYFAKGPDGKPVRETWEGAPAMLYQLITTHAQTMGIRTDSRGSWPKAPNAFTRVLNDIASSLQAVGYEITVKPGTPRKVIISIGKQMSLDHLVPQGLKPEKKPEVKVACVIPNPGKKGDPEPYFNHCYICGKPIFEEDSPCDDFTEHKPAHRKCYEDLKAQLKNGQS